MTENVVAYGKASLEAARKEQRKRIAAADVHAEQAPGEFLTAWKQAVLYIGSRYFDIEDTTVADATSRDQLRPDFNVINKSFGVLSHGEKVFLANLYCFFNAADGQHFIEQLSDHAQAVDQFRVLDLDGRQILCDLLRWDTGW